MAVMAVDAGAPAAVTKRLEAFAGEVLSAARAAGFAPDGAQVVVRGLCASCGAEAVAA